MKGKRFITTTGLTGYIVDVTIVNDESYYVLQFDDLNEGDYRLWKTDSKGITVIERQDNG